MLRQTLLALARRRHFVATPYDHVDTPLPSTVSLDKLFQTISDEAKVPRDWKDLDDAEVQRLLRVLPAYADSSKERYIQFRRTAAYFDLRRAAGHRARVRLHNRLDTLGDSGLQRWGKGHLFPAEP